jgi:hypothetical protein
MKQQIRQTSSQPQTQTDTELIRDINVVVGVGNEELQVRSTHWPGLVGALTGGEAEIVKEAREAPAREEEGWRVVAEHSLLGLTKIEYL